MIVPYRSNSIIPAEPERPSWIIRLWWSIFGRKIYTGPMTCAHCKYWSKVWTTKEEKRWSTFFGTNVWKDVKVVAKRGDCSLLYGKFDKEPDAEACERFSARRRYKHRVRT